ncbi:MAG: hypothetical protein HYS14_01435 [Candidatus Rokubacteria bacterium]|nr:hypothetical protein [Candidatus Rokubacteria bacterium]
MSHYEFCRRHPGASADDPNKAAFDAMQPSLLEFARMPISVNVQRQYLAGVPMSQLAFVGLVEEFDRGMELFRRIFGLPEVVLEPENVNPGKGIGGKTAGRQVRG